MTNLETLLDKQLLNQQSYDEKLIDDCIEQFPYFSIPQIIKALHINQENKGALIYNFNINPVMLKLLEKERASTVAEVNRETDNKASAKEDKNVEAELSALENDYTTECINSDYYAIKGNSISNELPERSELSDLINKQAPQEENKTEATPSITEKSLMVQMSFTDWMKTIAEKKRKEREEEEEKNELKNKWRQEKLAAAIQEENDEIPDAVFDMAVNSIIKDESSPTESLANIYLIQGKKDKAIEIYKKLILLFPEKKSYFADKINSI